MPKKDVEHTRYLSHPDRRRFLRTAGFGVAGLALGGSALSGCADSAQAGAYPQRPIQMIVAYEPGGGTDVGARILQPVLERALGGEIQIVNRPGGGGWAGWNDLARAEPDGYTLGFINTPNFMTGYLDPRLGRTDIDAGSFTLIANQVTDYGAIAISPDDQRFTDVRGLLEYAARERLIVTSTGVGSDDHFSALSLADRFGLRFDVLHNEGAADSVTDLLGGNVDAVFANVGELTAQHQDGGVKVVAVMKADEERSPYLPDVPTLAEAGYPDVESWSSRGIAGPAGLPAGVVERLVAACRTAIEDPAHVERLATQGLQVDYQAPDAYAEMIERDDRTARRLGERYIWGAQGG
ncbi:Bug family tripartite tricarboxylate transporter substrate binding protein [Allonocardiopsis opalescens]|uniref:Tripartite-type tricarboxylate transporter receptor subunit TctC n=1 Tax=Allonocardiopsis opalescens TaxID=1144618 RepID=A0A2T0QES9_9ACTN|nr:tripartite tricarboxylate transporter substrate binding protein [Allonocardiopsis opalescens]PRY02405.1 tripartite-type tricarboxylate transporter receptor subunit TctC [Allonocardiopsis opalescens]